MKGFQKSFLRGIGQTWRPAIHVGKNGIDPAFLAELARVLDKDELVKVRFAGRPDNRRELAQQMAEAAGAELVGVIGHTVLLFHEHPDPQRRQIRLPKRPDTTE